MRVEAGEVELASDQEEHGAHGGEAHEAARLALGGHQRQVVVAASGRFHQWRRRTRPTNPLRPEPVPRSACKSHAPGARTKPTRRATAANGNCLHRASTSASNSSVKPSRRPTQAGSTRRTLPSGSRTRGTRTSRKHSCWKKFKWRSRLTWCRAPDARPWPRDGRSGCRSRNPPGSSVAALLRQNRHLDKPGGLDSKGGGEQFVDHHGYWSCMAESVILPEPARTQHIEPI
jgi:hypothetical protein